MWKMWKTPVESAVAWSRSENLQGRSPFNRTQARDIKRAKELISRRITIFPDAPTESPQIIVGGFSAVDVFCCSPCRRRGCTLGDVPGGHFVIGPV
jgi:hypothetical protein